MLHLEVVGGGCTHDLAWAKVALGWLWTGILGLWIGPEPVYQKAWIHEPELAN